MCTLVSGTIASFRDLGPFTVRRSWLLLHHSDDITLIEAQTPYHLKMCPVSKTSLDIEFLSET